MYPPTTFTEPKPYGYLYLGMRVDPPARVPVVRASAKRRAAVEECVRSARVLTERPDVVSAVAYEATVIPPVRDSPRFDVLMLVETTSPESIATVQTDGAVQRLAPDFVMPARNVRRIGDIDRHTSGAFLFNHFTSADPQRALHTWDEITAWFTHEAGVTDSALLQPIDDAPYAFVNHVSLPTGPIRFLLQFAKPSFRRFVGARLTANGIGNAPVICRPA